MAVSNAQVSPDAIHRIVNDERAVWRDESRKSDAISGFGHDYVFFMHDDANGDESDWEPYLARSLSRAAAQLEMVSVCERAVRYPL